MRGVCPGTCYNVAVLQPLAILTPPVAQPCFRFRISYYLHLSLKGVKIMFVWRLEVEGCLPRDLKEPLAFLTPLAYHHY